jgi:hypothetical protein
MSGPIVLTIPEDVSDHVRHIAESADLSVEQLVIDRLRALSVLPQEIQDEVTALHYLSDDALWTIAQEQVPDHVQQRAQALMDKNTFGTITEQEREELQQVVDRADRLMLRKAEAAALLRERGHDFKQSDFKPRK